MQRHRSTTKLSADKYLLTTEVDHLEQTLEKFYAEDFRNCLLLEFLMRTGVRVQEALNVEKKDLNHELKSVYIYTLKGGIDRDLPLPNKLWARLKKYAATVKGEKIFEIGYDMAREVWLEYRPVKKKLHSLRHSAAIRFYKKSRSIHMVMKIMGHADVQTTMIYVNFTEDREKMRKLI